MVIPSPAISTQRRSPESPMRRFDSFRGTGKGDAHAVLGDPGVKESGEKTTWDRAKTRRK